MQHLRLSRRISAPLPQFFSRTLSAGLFLSSALLIGGASAATKTWIGSNGSQWSVPANWSPSGSPVDGDSLVFPSTASIRITTNDISNLTVVGLQFTSSGYTISGNALTVSGTYGTTGGNTINAPLTFVGTAFTLNGDTFSDVNTTSASPISFVGTEHTGAFAAGSSDVGFSNALLRGSLTGSGRINPNGSGALNYIGSSTYTGTVGGIVNLGGGQLPAAALVGGEINGNGTIGTVRDATFIRPRQLNANNRGRIPASSGILSIGTAVGGNYSLQLRGPVAGTDYSQVVISNSVSLDGDLYLAMDENFFPRVGDRFTIIENRGSQPVSGIFNYLSEGGTFPFDNGYVLQISYRGGDGNDVTLTVVQAPNLWRGPNGGVWSNPDNWTQGTPQNGQIIGFDSRLLAAGNGVSYVVHNDLVGLELSSINFASSAIEVRGNRLTVSQSINGGSYSHFAAPVFLRGSVLVGRDGSTNPYGAPLFFSGGVEIGASGSILDNVIIANLNTNAFDVAIGGRLQGTLSGNGSIQAALAAWPYGAMPTISLEIAASGTFSGTLNGNSSTAPARAFVGAIKLGNAALPNAKLIGQYALVEGGASSLDSINVDRLDLYNDLSVRSARIAGRATYFFRDSRPRPVLHAREEINFTNALLSLEFTSQFLVPSEGLQLAMLAGATPISGSFSNQPEGSTIRVGGKDLYLSYRGGDGNDLTLAPPRNQAATTTAVTVSPNPVNPSESVAISVRVSSTGTTVPTGDVTFFSNSASPIVRTLIAGSTSINSTFGLGSQTVRAVYSGDSANASSEGSAIIDVRYTVRIETETLPNGVVGTSYEMSSFSVSGGFRNYQASIVDGALPFGLSLDGLRLRGTPLAQGSFTFTLSVRDSSGATGARTFTMNVLPPPNSRLSLTYLGSPRLPPGVISTPYVPLYFGASGGTPPYTYSALDPLPPGMRLSASGVLSGTPSEVNTYSFQVQVRDATGAEASTREFFETLATAIPTPPTSVVTPDTQLVGTPIVLQTSATPNFDPSFVSLTPNVCVVRGPVVSHLLPGTCSIAVNFRFGSYTSVYDYTVQRIVSYSVASVGLPVPTNLVCTAQVLGASCQFSAPGGSAASSVDGYGLRCASSLTTREMNGTASPIIITGLNAAEQYSCTVWAIAGGSRGTPSAPSNVFVPLPGATPPNPNAPPPPQINRAIGGDGEAIVAFTGIPADARFPIMYYKVSALPMAGEVSCSAPCSSIKVPGLTNDVTYTFSVAATNSQGTSDASARSNPVTPSQNTPLRLVASPLAQQPGGIDVDGNNGSQILVRVNATGVIQVGRFNGSVFGFENVAQVASPGRVLAAGDFNSSGVSSLLFQDLANGDPGMVFVQPLNGGALSSARALKQTWIPEAVADLDGDGTTDVAFRYTGTEGRPEDIGVSYIWFMKRNGIEQVRKRGGAPLTWKLLGAADFNGDYAADMVYISPTNQVRVLMATANRTCANLLAGALPSGFIPIKVADFEGNGRGSLLLRNPASGATLLFGIDARGVTLPAPTANPDDLNASCTSTTQSPTSYVVSIPSSAGLEFLAAGDFNGDGIWDILWRNPATGSMTLWLMRADSAQPDVRTGIGALPAGVTLLQP